MRIGVIPTLPYVGGGGMLAVTSGLYDGASDVVVVGPLASSLAVVLSSIAGASTVVGEGSADGVPADIPSIPVQTAAEPPMAAASARSLSIPSCADATFHRFQTAKG